MVLKELWWIWYPREDERLWIAVIVEVLKSYELLVCIREVVLDHRKTEAVFIIHSH